MEIIRGIYRIYDDVKVYIQIFNIWRQLHKSEILKNNFNWSIWKVCIRFNWNKYRDLKRKY